MFKRRLSWAEEENLVTLQVDCAARFQRTQLGGSDALDLRLLCQRSRRRVAGRRCHTQLAKLSTSEERTVLFRGPDAPTVGLVRAAAAR